MLSYRKKPSVRQLFRDSIITAVFGLVPIGCAVKAEAPKAIPPMLVVEGVALVMVHKTGRRFRQNRAAQQANTPS